MAGGELRIGVIGAGGRGGLATRAHKPGDGSRVVACCDVVPAVFDRCRELYGPGVFCTEDYRDLLARDDVDAVFVTSPDYCHEAHATAALAAGKHVYLEKPMAITIAGCDRILQAAYESRAKLYLGHNMRHMTFTIKMKELIGAGAIGEVQAAWCRHFVCYGCDAYFKDWHAERDKSTGMLLQKAAHDIDILHWLCGGYSKRVVGMGQLSVYSRITDRHGADDRGDASWHVDNWPPLAQKGLNPIVDVEDHSMMLMQLDNGVQASYQQCHYAPDGWRNYCVIGTRGRIENFGDSPGECVVRVWNRRAYYNPYGDEQHFIPPASGGHGGADPAIVAEFVRYVREGGTIATSAVAARQAVAAGCLATKSLREGNTPQDVPPVPPEWVEYFEADVA